MKIITDIVIETHCPLSFSPKSTSKIDISAYLRCCRRAQILHHLMNSVTRFLIRFGGIILLTTEAFILNQTLWTVASTSWYFVILLAVLNRDHRLQFYDVYMIMRLKLEPSIASLPAGYFFGLGVYILVDNYLGVTQAVYLAFMPRRLKLEWRTCWHLSSTSSFFVVKRVESNDLRHYSRRFCKVGLMKVRIITNFLANY